MIDVRNAGKIYGRSRRSTGLEDVSLTVRRGTVTAVVGPNGAGKSTLFGLILGFLRPTSGDVTIDDMDPQDYVRANGVGYLPERFSLPPEWPVRRAVAALGGLAGVAESAGPQALESFGLEDHADKAVGSLSHGLLQRLGLALAFAPARELIVLDEPGEGLDPLWRIQLRDRITQQRELGRTVLLASHDLGEVERVTDTVIILEQHKVRDVLDLSSVTPPGALAYRITLDEPVNGLTNFFPHATPYSDLEYGVTAAGTHDLNTRVAALIESGARITKLQPDAERLEERVRRTIAP